MMLWTFVDDLHPLLRLEGDSSEHVGPTRLQPTHAEPVSERNVFRYLLRQMRRKVDLKRVIENHAV